MLQFPSPDGAVVPLLEKAAGTLTKKLMLRFLFFIELNNDFVVVTVVGGGDPKMEIPPFLLRDPTEG